MTETQFIEKNKDKWQELEHLLSMKNRDPDRLHNLFVKVSSDLAYASTFYPKRSVRAYLNQLTQQVFDSMEKKKTEWSLDGIKHFFSDTLPEEMYRSRKSLLISFLIFIIALLIGIVSAANNPDFCGVILGDDYVAMTEDNINNGDPMAVYKDSEQSDMFFYITVNNIKVVFLCFVMGLLGSLGTIIILLYNGIMVGAFQYFFYSKGLFVESFLTIWIHGTIEISAIIIAGAAGIVLGNGLLFPKTYTRATSLQISAKRSVRILLGTVPLFIIAGFLESFVTRLTEMPMFIKILIIATSLLFILGLYVIYPRWYYKNILPSKEPEEIVPDNVESISFRRDQLRSFGDNLALTFSQFRNYMTDFIQHGFIPIAVTFVAFLSIYQVFISPHTEFPEATELIMNIQYGGLFMFFVYWTLLTYIFMILSMIYREEKLTKYNKMVHMKYGFMSMMLVTLVPLSLVYFTNPAYILVLLLIIPPMFFINMINNISKNGWSAWKDFSKIISNSYSNWLMRFLAFGIIGLLHFMIFIVISSNLGGLVFDFFYWHDIFEGLFVTRVIISTIIYTLVHIFTLPLYYFILLNFHYSDASKRYATDLWNRFENFGKQSSIFEPKT